MEIGGLSSGASLSSAAGIERLITQSMALERQPVTRLKTQKDDLEVKKAIYSDIKKKLETLNSAVQDLTGDDGILNKYKATFTTENILDISVDSTNSNISAAQYSVTVDKLAQAHRLSSIQQSDTTTALNLSGDLTINGQTITIDTTDNLNDIKSKINGIDFEDAGVETVEATIVDNKLVLSSVNTGTDATITFTDDTNGGNGLGLNQIQEAQNAEITVNGLSVVRQSNTGLDDIIDGLTFNLKEEGSTGVTISKDNSDVKKKVESVLEAFNDVIKHLKLKTEPQLDTSSVSNNPTYTAAPLGRDFNIKSLRFNLASDLLSIYSDSEANGPRTLSDIGITIGADNVSFELSDSSTLTSALDDNIEGVADLLNFVLDKIETRANTYLDGTDALITTAQDDIDDRIDYLDDQIKNYETRLSKREEVLRKQFYELQSQLINMQYQFQTTQAAMFGSINILNQQG